MKTLLVALTILLLAGCSSAQQRRDAAADSNKAQKEFIAAQDAAQKPILEMEGIDGQPMSLSGVKALRVYAPQPKQAWVPAQVQRSDLVEALSIGKDLALGFIPLGMTRAVVGGVTQLGNNIERAGTKGYDFVQAPPVSGAVDNSVHTVGDNSGANSGNSGKIAGTSLTDTNSGASSGTDVDNSNQGNSATTQAPAVPVVP